MKDLSLAKALRVFFFLLAIAAVLFMVSQQAYATSYGDCKDSKAVCDESLARCEQKAFGGK